MKSFSGIVGAAALATLGCDAGNRHADDALAGASLPGVSATRLSSFPLIAEPSLRESIGRVQEVLQRSKITVLHGAINFDSATVETVPYVTTAGDTSSTTVVQIPPRGMMNVPIFFVEGIPRDLDRLAVPGALVSFPSPLDRRDSATTVAYANHLETTVQSAVLEGAQERILNSIKDEKTSSSTTPFGDVKAQARQPFPHSRALDLRGE